MPFIRNLALVTLLLAPMLTAGCSDGVSDEEQEAADAQIEQLRQNQYTEQPNAGGHDGQMSAPPAENSGTAPESSGTE